MRPRGWYVLFDLGRVVAVCHGNDEARRLAPGRAYKRFTSQLEAEEFAMWWDYLDSPVSTTAQTASRNRPRL